MSEQIDPPLQVLSYSNKQKLEQTTVRCLGVLSLAISLPGVIYLFVQAIEFAFFEVPHWIPRVFFFSKQGFSKNHQEAFFDIWSEIYHPFILPLVSIFLLAGAIGCLRKYPRARAWMILFAYLKLLTVLINMFYVLVRASEGMSFPGYYYYGGRDKFDHIVLQTVHESAWEAAFAVLIIWLMTRRYVKEMYTQRIGDE